MTYITENNSFETTDINLAATLFFFGFEIEGIDKSNPIRATFIFKRGREIDATIQGFWAQGLVVEPIGYFNAIKQVKTRLYRVER